MKKVKKIINKKIIITVLITMIISITIGVKAATMFSSNDVIYDNSSSGTTSNTVKEALDELYEKANNCGSTSSICTSTSGTVSYALGTEYTCDPGDGVERTFYVLDETKNNVDLIMNENIGSKIGWNSSGGVPVIALTYLESQTSSWTVDVSLPTGQQIADAVGSTTWPCIDSRIDISSASWLYENLNLGEGYWTSTPEPRIYFGDPDGAYFVVYDDYYEDFLLKSMYIGQSYSYQGIRPVITIPKDQLS